MPLSKERNQSLVSDYGRHQNDSGSSEVQIAMLTQRINDLSAHLIKNPKDFSTRRGLLRMVSQRSCLLAYFKKHHELEQYRGLIQRLNLRK